MQDTAGIHIKNLNKSFGSREVIKDLSLEISAGSFVSIVGPSGCGKSTLLRLVAGLEKPNHGQIELPSQKIGFVFQESNLLPWRTAFENVVLPFELDDQAQGLSKKDIQDKARTALAKVKLSEAADLFPHELSGGMKMRVAIARALVAEPRLLLLDEPFAALDEFTRSELQMQLRELWQSAGITVLFVTHSLMEASFLSERIVMLKGPGAPVVYDKVLNLPKERTEELRTSDVFNKTIRELTEGLRQ